MLFWSFMAAAFIAGGVAGYFGERARMNALIKASFVKLPGLPQRIAIIKETTPENRPPIIEGEARLITWEGNCEAR